MDEILRDMLWKQSLSLEFCLRERLRVYYTVQNVHTKPSTNCNHVYDVMTHFTPIYKLYCNSPVQTVN